jgi:alpha-glucosidase
MHQFIKILLTVSAFTSTVHSEWYDNANFYQIYPRSFMDSNGDGIGDLRGIISKLSYLKDLGIDGVWLSPIFKSPMADFGYDISDYRDIQDEYGTLDDFQVLVDECNKLGIKLILDFVPNHTSDEHEWFKRSERNETDYKDFYIWQNPIVDPISNVATPPNNWISVMRYSAWRWSNVRQQMYYHAFHRKQVDLNYRNAKVVDEMKNVLKYWLDKGVDGFRIDAVPLIYEKMNGDGTYPSEPRTYKPGCDQNDRCSLQPIYTMDQPETYDLIYQWRKLIDDYSAERKVDKKVLMVEAAARLDLQMQYYGNGSTLGAQIPFNFELMLKLNKSSKAQDYKTLIEQWLKAMPANQMANWVLGNHDQHRIASR